jgi:hypothetical protein
MFSTLYRSVHCFVQWWGLARSVRKTALLRFATPNGVQARFLLFLFLLHHHLVSDYRCSLERSSPERISSRLAARQSQSEYLDSRLDSHAPNTHVMRRSLSRSGQKPEPMSNATTCQSISKRLARRSLPNKRSLSRSGQKTECSQSRSLRNFVRCWT